MRLRKDIIFRVVNDLLDREFMNSLLFKEALQTLNYLNNEVLSDAVVNCMPYKDLKRTFVVGK